MPTNDDDAKKAVKHVDCLIFSILHSLSQLPQSRQLLVSHKNYAKILSEPNETKDDTSHGLIYTLAKLIMANIVGDGCDEEFKNKFKQFEIIDFILKSIVESDGDDSVQIDELLKSLSIISSCDWAKSVPNWNLPSLMDFFDKNIQPEQNPGKYLILFEILWNFCFIHEFQTEFGSTLKAFLEKIGTKCLDDGVEVQRKQNELLFILAQELSENPIGKRNCSNGISVLIVGPGPDDEICERVAVVLEENDMAMATSYDCEQTMEEILRNELPKTSMAVLVLSEKFIRSAKCRTFCEFLFSIPLQFALISQNSIIKVKLY